MKLQNCLVYVVGFCLIAVTVEAQSGKNKYCGKVSYSLGSQRICLGPPCNYSDKFLLEDEEGYAIKLAADKDSEIGKKLIEFDKNKKSICVTGSGPEKAFIVKTIDVEEKAPPVYSPAPKKPNQGSGVQ